MNDRGVMGQSGDNGGFNVVARTIDHLEKETNMENHILLISCYFSFTT